MGLSRAGALPCVPPPASTLVRALLLRADAGPCFFHELIWMKDLICRSDFWRSLL